MGGDETIFELLGGVGRILLNRPKVLNALSAAQYGEISDRLRQWEQDGRITVVLVEGEGERAFCAGGDIRIAYDAHLKGDLAFARRLFQDEYRMDRLIHRYSKPYVSLLDGIVMGGGAGLSVNGRFRVATERTQFAMPETGIGFFPDVGATHFLNRCPGHLGLYLGLSGARLGPADALWAGIATHFVPGERLDGLRAALAKASVASDPAAAVAAVLASFHHPPAPGPMAARAEAVERCFAAPDLETILDRLRAEKSEWAADTLDELAGRSPTSLAVTFRQLTEGRGLDFDDAIRREYRLAWRFVAGGEFYEGIRAQVVDKDRRPKWSPATLAEVREWEVSACFARLPDDQELPLP